VSQKHCRRGCLCSCECWLFLVCQLSRLSDVQDVMVVGEPTLMGGEFGDKDERLIARLENTQYDPSEQPEETANPTTADHCVRPVPGTSAPSTNTFGAPPPVTITQARARPCPTGSPTAIQSGWGMDNKIALPPPQPQSGSAIPNDKLSSKFE